MDYFKIEFQTSTENAEMLLALLGNLSFDVFEETEKGLNAFIPVKDFNQEIETEIEKLKQLFDFSHQKSIIKYKNWNAEWEANFQPILVNDFCGIRADFHDPIHNVANEIIINPKMAFGTGHHETTWMMIAMMENINFSNKKVLDFGCGTGILAILAAQIGAKMIDAIDIELPSFENTLENSRINKIEVINSMHGTIENVQQNTYDIILANINRHVILDTLSTLIIMLNPGGKLLISGILIEDKELVHGSAKEIGFQIEKTIQKNNWICSLLKVNVEN